MEFIEKDHRELDHLLAEVEFLAERRAFESAAQRFGAFQQRFLEHLLAEERDFPPAAWRELRSQHAQLEVALSAVLQALHQRDYAQFTYGVSALCDLLRKHQAKEEQLLMTVMPRVAAS